jgi:predicted transcriptional regulator
MAFISCTQVSKAIVDRGTGDKRVEFRKRVFRHPIRYVVIYATSPVKSIIGFCRVGRIRVDSPSQIWKEYQSIGGVAAGTYKSYYANSSIAVAIEMEQLYIFAHPISLMTLPIRITPPRSYNYVPFSVFETLFEGAFVAGID